MVIDRSKHNKYVAKPTYQPVSQDQQTSANTTVVYMTGGGGSSGGGSGLTAEQLDKLNSIEYGAQVNQNAFSYLNLATQKQDNTEQAYTQEARIPTDTANITINGVGGVTVDLLTSTGIQDVQVQSIGTNTSVWQFSYGKVETEVPSTEEPAEGEEPLPPTIVTTYPLVMTWISGTKLLATDFDHIVLYSKGEVLKSYDQSQLQIAGDETGIATITIIEEGLYFDHVYFTLTPEPVEGQELVTTNVCIFQVLVTTTGIYTISTADGSYWILDEEHDAIYTKYNVYSMQEIAAYGYGTGGPGSGGAQYLKDLKDVNSGAGTNPTEDGMLLMWNSTSQSWNYVAKDAVGLNEEELEQYLTNNNYVKKDQFGDLFMQELEKLFRIIYDDSGNIIIAIEALYDFYSVGEVAAYGLGEGGVAPSGTEYLYELKDINGGAGTQPTEEGTLIMWNGSTWAYVSRDSVGLNTSELQQFLSDNKYLKDPIGWNNISENSLPTTLEGYGITDAYTMQQADDRYVNITGDTMTGDLYLPSAIATNYIQIGDARLMYDAENHAIYVKYKDDTQVANFYSEGEVSAYGVGDEGSADSTQYLYELKDVNSGLGTTPSSANMLLMWDGTTWQYISKNEVGLNTAELEQYLTNNSYIQQDDLTWSNILNKPTTLAGYGITDGVNQVTTSGTGNVVVSGSISGHTLTLNKSLTVITDIYNSGSGNAVTGISKSGDTLYVYKDSSFAYTNGSNATGTWGIDITGNAATASELEYARTITLTGAITGSVSFDGSRNVTMTTYYETDELDDIYVNETGDTMTGQLGMNYTNSYSDSDSNFMNGANGYIYIPYIPDIEGSTAQPILTWSNTGYGGYATSYFIGSRRSSSAEWGILRLAVGVSPNNGGIYAGDILSYIDIYALAGRRGKVKIYGDLFVDGYISASSEITAYSDANGAAATNHWLTWSEGSNDGIHYGNIYLGETSTTSANDITNGCLYLNYSESNPYYALRYNNLNWFIQGYDSPEGVGLYIGRGTSYSMRIDQNGNVYIPGDLEVGGDMAGGDSYWSGISNGIRYNNVFISTTSVTGSNTATGSLYMLSDATNPYYALRHSSGVWYVQAYNGTAGNGLYIGPASTSKSMYIDSNGNVAIPRNLAVGGSIEGYYTANEVDDLLDGIGTGGDSIWTSASSTSIYWDRIYMMRSGTASSQLSTSRSLVFKSDYVNPLIGFYDGSDKWYVQIENSVMYLGCSSGKSLQVDTNGNLIVPGSIQSSSDFKVGPGYSSSSLSTGVVLRTSSDNPYVYVSTSSVGAIMLQISGGNDCGCLGFRINRTSFMNYSMWFYNDGHITTAGAVSTRSDIRLKSDISQLEYKGYATPIIYTMDGKRQIGFAAQDVLALYPELVESYIDETSNEEYYALDYAQYTAVLQAQLIQHEDELTTLKNRVQVLEDKLSQYESIN